jgi:hypothetical protein
MGWDVTQVGKNISTKKFLEWDILNSIGANYKLVALGEGKNEYGQKPFYAAIKNVDSGKVFAVVYLTKRRNGSIAVKDVSENAGPYYFDCPAKVFNLLTKTDNEWALEWRFKVKAYLAEKAAA